MEFSGSVWVMGGDLRQAWLARLLERDGLRVRTYALEDAPPPLPGAEGTDLTGLEEADCVLLPMPPCRLPGELNAPLSSQKHPIAPLLGALAPGTLVCAGKVDGETAALAQKGGLRLVDYLEREELAVANAQLTAEGAVGMALDLLPVSLLGARVLVLGCGRVGQATALALAALGARVKVAARRSAQLAWAAARGLEAVPLARLGEALEGLDLAVNTVPAPLLGEGELLRLDPACPILELASPPGGVDREAAARLGRRVVPAPGLPGRTAPASAAAAIRDTLYNIFHELGR